MELGLTFFPTVDSIHPTRLGPEAEARGLDSIFCVEHTHIPASRRTPYPMGGELPAIYVEAYEPLTFLAMVAASTKTLKVGTGVCLAAQHHPLALAKRVASLDALSNGRVLLGVGGGWNAEEMENHGFPFEERWQRLEEHVRAMKACWTQKDAEFHGRFVDFDPVWVEPKPVSRPHPPVLIGAHSKWAIPRVVDWAEGWLPIVMGPEFDDRLAELDRLCEEKGRDRAEINVTAISFAQTPDDLYALAKKGVDRVLLGVPTESEKKVFEVLDGHAKLVEAVAGF
jgi:probable F420-dependent oxidoreductase